MENSACLLEAQQIIHDWLKDDSEAVNYERGYTPPRLPSQNRVKTQSKHAKSKAVRQLNNDDPSALSKEWNGGLESKDYISRMDFVNTDISHCVEQVMAGMYTHPVEHDVLKMMESQPTTSNPAVTMEMRHKQVKSRRQHREQHRSILLKAQAAEKESRLAAERRVKSEQEALKVKRRQEEALVRLEMVKIRRQLKERQERERLLQEVDESLGNGARVFNYVPSPPHAVLSTAQQVMDEELKYRMIAETRRVLVKQLAEAEVSEVKANNKLLRQCFNTWLDVVNGAKLIQERACALWAWQTKCSVFRSWRRLVEQNKRQQELAALALQLQWEKRCSEMAVLHHHHTLVAKVFTSWKRWLRDCQEQRSVKLTRQRQQHKMAALLSRVTAACHHDGSTMEREDQCSPSGVLKETQHHVGAEKGSRVVEHSGVSTQSDLEGYHDPTDVKKKRQLGCHHSQPPTVKRQDPTVGLITSKLVRQELEKLLAEKRVLAAAQGNAVPDDHMNATKIETVPVTPVTSESIPKQQLQQEYQQKHKQQQQHETNQSVKTVGDRQSSSLKKQYIHKTLAAVVKQPPTKPLPLLGMERRAHMMAERRQARMDRQRQREEQILAAKQKEREEKEAAALAEKEALIRKKKEERQLAKQKEKEKQRQLAEFQQKVATATNHYNDWLLKFRGILPWKQFIANIHEDNKTAKQFHIEYVMKATLLVWKQHYDHKCELKNRKADKFYNAMVTRRFLALWKKYVKEMKYFSRHIEQWYRWLLVRRCFKGWYAYVRQEEIKTWEKERRAKVHRNWCLKRKVLLLWHHFVPFAKEEKLREQRREDMRKKVAKWLPDYQTAINSED